MAYSAEQKAMALAVVERHGELSKAALDEIRQLLELPKLGKTTVHRWLKVGTVPDNSTKTESNGTDSEMESQKKARSPVVTQDMVETAHIKLEDLYEKVTRKYLAHALNPEVVADLDGKQAVTAAAIATDKMRLLTNLPTVIIGILPDLVRNIEAAGHSPEAIFDALNDRMLAELNDRAVLH